MFRKPCVWPPRARLRPAAEAQEAGAVSPRRWPCARVLTLPLGGVSRLAEGARQGQGIGSPEPCGSPSSCSFRWASWFSGGRAGGKERGPREPSCPLPGPDRAPLSLQASTTRPPPSCWTGGASSWSCGEWGSRGACRVSLVALPLSPRWALQRGRYRRGLPWLVGPARPALLTAPLCFRDTSGQGRFCTIFRSYSRGAQVSLAARVPRPLPEAWAPP